MTSTTKSFIPKPHWFWGHTKLFAADTKGFVTSLIEGTPSKEIFSTKIAFKKFHFLLDPEHIKHALVSNHREYHKSFAYKGIKDILGNGLLSTENTQWQSDRKKLQPEFLHQKIGQFAPTITQITKTHLKTLSSTKNSPTSLSHFLNGLTGDIMGALLFGHNPSLAQTLAPKIGKILPLIANYANNQMKNPLALGLWFPNKENQELLKTKIKVTNILSQEISERIDKNDIGEDLLGAIIKAYSNEPDIISLRKTIVDQVLTLLVAGQDTTTNALVFLFHEIGTNNTIAESLPNENPQHLKNCISEILRLYPPAWAISRKAIQDLQIGNTSIKKGDTLFLSIYALHRHKDYWDNPNSFDPDRFNNPYNKEVYMPFGKGPRICIGIHLAQMIMEIISGNILEHFKIQLVDQKPLKIITPMTMRPLNDIFVQFQKR